MAPSGLRVSPVGVGLIAGFVALFLWFAFLRQSHDPNVDLKQLLVAGIDFAERGGDQVRAVKESKDLQEQSKGKTMEGANDPLTMGDQLSHQAITGSFKASFPYVPLVSEEKDADITLKLKAAPIRNLEVDKIIGEAGEIIPNEDVTIWVDPLDATQEYTESLLRYVTTMVCIAVKGKPVIGIIHKPFEKKTYWSWAGHGTNIVDNSKKDQHNIIVSRKHKGDVEKVVHEKFGETAVVIPAGGAGYKSLALFDGTASLYIHTTLIKKWDICAGNAILNEAGGKMTTLKGEEIDYSASGDAKSQGGILAALHNYEEYKSKMGD